MRSWGQRLDEIVRDDGATIDFGGACWGHDFNYVYDDDIIRLLTPAVQVLNVRDCYQLGDPILVAAARCPQLTSLDVSECYDVTDAGIIAVAENCPMLSKLAFMNCSNITVASLRAIKNLTDLDCTCCPTSRT